MKRISLLLLGLCFVTWAAGCCCWAPGRCGRCARCSQCGDPCGGMASGGMAPMAGGGGCCGDGGMASADYGMNGQMSGGCASGNCGHGGMASSGGMPTQYDEGSGWTPMAPMTAPGSNQGQPTPIQQIPGVK